MKRISVPFAVMLLAALLTLLPAVAAAIDLQFQQVASTSRVVDIRNAGDGSDRLFLVRRSPGEIRVLKNGTVLNTPFLDIDDRVRSSGNEQGLLSLAFPPDYATSGLFFVWYTDLAGDMQLSRFEVSGNPDVANAASETKLLVVPQPASNHNGGRLLFGPDGMLYLGIGDGGGSGDPQDNGQATDTLLGKLIRIDVNPQFIPYGIPPDNPYISDGDVLDEIWATGLRNPWRMSFDRDTGDLYIADVGQNRIEEIDFQPADSNGGENYGWNIMEGDECFTSAQCDTSGLTLPVAQYAHNLGCSVTGGEVYRGEAYPDLASLYLYGDYCSGRIWGLSRNGSSWQNQLLADTSFNLVTFGESEVGEVFLSDSNDVFLVIDADANPEPDIFINAGMNDAWVSDDAPLQGFFLTVYPGLKALFLSWFTFDSDPPGQGASAVFGAPDQRWVTGIGEYSGDRVTMDVELTSGGVFNASDPLANQAPTYGIITIDFSSCEAAVLTYDFPSDGLSGEISLRRALPDGVVICEALQPG